MARLVTYSNRAVRGLRRLHRQDAERLLSAIERLAESGDGDIVNLQGRDGYRLRVGQIRALFDMDESTIHVLDVGYRGGIY